MFSFPSLVVPHLRSRLVALSLGFIALLSVFAFNAQAQQLSIPGLRAPQKNPAAKKEMPAEVRAAQGEAPLNRLYDYVRVEPSKIRRLPALAPGMISEEKSEKKVRIGVVRTFSRPVRVSSDSTRYSLAEGDVHVIGLISEGAVYTRAHFTNVSLPAGARLFVYSRKNPEEFYGPYEGRGPSGDGTFWTPPMEGDSVAIEYFTPTAVSDTANAPFQISEVSHIYRSLFTDENPDNATAGSCNLEVTDGWSEVAKSVGHLQFTSGRGEFMCTGTLLNNPTNDQTPYLLTANHCFNTQASAQSLRVYWFYNTGDTPAPGTPRTDGANLLSSDSSSDFTLVRLTGSLPGGLYFSGWDANPTPVSTSVTGLHHPQGSHKRASFGSTISGCGSGLPGQCQNFTNVRWDDGTTEPGSSGSGLWAGPPSDPRLVGNLTGGYAACNNLSGTDYYGSFSLTYKFIWWLLTGEVTDLAISQVATTSQVAPGSTVTYYITVTNNVGATALPAIVTDNLPAGLTYNFCNANDGGGECSRSGNNVSIRFSPLAAGKSGTAVISATVNDSVGLDTVISNTATISSTRPDPNMSNNASTANFVVKALPRKPTANGRIVFGSDRASSSSTQPSGIYTINPNGTAESLLFNIEPFASPPAWSPDGTKIAYGKRGSGTYGDEIYVANADGTGSVKVAGNVFNGNRRIAWSPDGSRLAFIGPGPAAYIVNPDGTGLSKILFLRPVFNDLAWSPDGSMMAYTDGTIIHVVTLDGDKEWRLSPAFPSINGEQGRSILPRWSPDGSKILFVLETNNYKNIFVVDSRGGNLMPFITLHQSTQPAFSPDGTKVTFIALNSLYVANVDGTGATQITNNGFYNFHPDWQPLITNGPIQLALDQSGPDALQASALDSTLFLRDPFPVVNAGNIFNQGADKNTRVILLTANLQLATGETASSVIVNLVGSNSQSYDVSAEDVRPLPLSNFTQVRFRLPDSLAPGTYTIKVKAHGQESNSGTIRIRS